MSDYPKFFSHGEEPESLDSIRPDEVPPLTGRIGSLIRDRRFRTACAASFSLHIVIFASALWTPSSARYRFYGSGTAVSLVGADEIPGGSARGKSGDRPEEIQKPETSQKKKTIKVEPKKKEKVPKKIVKKIQSKSKKKIERKKPERKIAVKPEKKKPSKKELAHLKRIKERRERQRKWRERWEKKKNNPIETAKNETVSAEKIKGEGAGNDALAKSTDLPRKRPLTGYPGEGGGDGQGGGSLGGGSGGVARTDIERYYGLLAERIRNFWTVPPNLSDVANLKTEVVVDVARDGSIRNLRIKEASGNRVYDAAALRAVERSAAPSFPPPPNTMKDRWLLLGFRFCGHNFCRK